jgi:hypothetical protein
LALLPPQLESLDEWIADQDGEMSRPEAIRRLLDAALVRARKGKIERGLAPARRPAKRKDVPR